MIKKIVLKLYLKYFVSEVAMPDDEIDAQYRQDAYALLYENVKMMKVLQKILVEDTKKMVESDWQSKDKALMRAAMFLRTKAIYDKAKELYEKSKEK